MTPCGWTPVFSDCDCEGTCCHLATLSPVMAEAVKDAAATWLWEVTGRRYGNCEAAFRPCLKRCHSGPGVYGGPAWSPYREGGSWYNAACARCGDSCSCTSLSELILPTVGTVTEVSMYGVPMPDGSWRVDNMRRLVRIDGGRWPTCQDMTADPAEWQVTYQPGYDLPVNGQLAYGAFVCQLARLVCGEKCQLPAGVTSVQRQGVTIQVAPTTEAVTGLWVVDSWTAMVNRPQAKVWSPDMSVTRTVPLNV